MEPRSLERQGHIRVFFERFDQRQRDRAAGERTVDVATVAPIEHEPANIRCFLRDKRRKVIAQFHPGIAGVCVGGRRLESLAQRPARSRAEGLNSDVASVGGGRIGERHRGRGASARKRSNALRLARLDGVTHEDLLDEVVGKGSESDELGPRANGRQELARLGAEKDESGMGRRFLQRLEQGVGGADAQLVGGADDDDPLRGLVGTEVDPLEHDAPDLIDGDVGLLVGRTTEDLAAVEVSPHQHDVGVHRDVRALGRERERTLARRAGAAPLEGGRRAHDRARESERGALFSDSVGACEEERVMELAARQAAPQRLDRVRLTEDIAKRHEQVVGRSRWRGKTTLAALIFVLSACAAEPKPAAVPMPPETVAAPAPSYTYAPPTGPIEESRKALANAHAEKDPHERCRLLQEAAILDPSSFDARRARAESRCAPALDLLADARFVFSARRDAETAAILKNLALRAEDAAAMKEAAEAFLEQKDFYNAAAMFVALGDHVRAATAFRDVAVNRAAKGATVDALDARLAGIIESARAKTKVVPALEAILDAAIDAKKSYGAAWVAPKFIEALAAARNAGEDTAALASRAEKQKLFVGAEDAFEIERAIAASRSGKPEPTALIARVRTRASDPAVRALLAVTAKSCADRLAHARAHKSFGEAALRLDDDVDWARSKCTGTVARTSLFAPHDPADVADAKGIVDPPVRRSRTLALVKLRPDDVAAAAWAALVADYYPPASLLSDPAVQESLWDRSLAATTGKPSLARTRAYVDALRATVEADVPRATAELIASILERARIMTVDSRPGWEEIAAFVVQDCAARLPGKCLKTESLAHSTELLRSPRPFVLATHGMKLSKEDFADPRVRLDVIFALVLWEKHLKEAILLRGSSYGPFTGPEASLASALIAATAGNCVAARVLQKEAAALNAEYADADAYLAKSCK